jgi:hypothetical protein
MSDLAALVAQLSAKNAQPAPDAALAVAKLARASIEALVLKLGKTVDAKVIGQIAGNMTQLSAGDETLVLKLETPLRPGTAVTIKVTSTPQGAPSVTVTVPPTTARPAQILPVRTAATTLVEGEIPTPLAPAAGRSSLAAASTKVPAQQAPAIPAPTAQPGATASAATRTANAETQAPLPRAQAPTLAPSTPAPAPAQGAASLVRSAQQLQQNATSVETPAAPPLPAGPATPHARSSPAQPAPQLPLSTAPPTATTSPAAAPPLGAVPKPPSPPATNLSPSSVPPPVLPSSMQARVQATPPQAPAAASPPIPAAASPAAAVAPVLSAPLSAQPHQLLPTHPSPYPIQLRQPPPAAEAQQLALAAPQATALRPSAPPLNLTDPAQAAARQDSVAPLMARLAALVTAAAPSLPRPMLELALKMLANRIDLNRGAPDAKTLEAAVMKSGVLSTPQSRDGPPDTKTSLLALRTGLLALLGNSHSDSAPIAAAQRPVPPMKGEAPRAPLPHTVTQQPDAETPQIARTLLDQTDAALSRLKLLQSASQPANDARPDAPAPRTELRVEIPMMLGTETGILQLMVERDARHKREPERQRGWRMRFAMNFSATGEVGADISLLGRAASIAIWAADPDVAEALDSMLPELGPAISRHGLELTSLRVRRGTPQHAPATPGRLLDSAR